MGASIGSKFVAVCLLFFAFSTILSWNLFGKINAVYLFGKKIAPLYAIIALGFIFLGNNHIRYLPAQTTPRPQF